MKKVHPVFQSFSYLLNLNREYLVFYLKCYNIYPYRKIYGMLMPIIT